MWCILYLAVAILQPGISLAQLNCPDCKTHEGRLECHPGPHPICHEDEVCQIHAHEERGSVTMETHCSPSEHCLREEGHDPVRCAQGLIETGPHGCVWCCSDKGCVDRYHYLLFPHMFTSPGVPVPTRATTPGISLAPLYCPDCKTHEGRLECHPGPHPICHEDEVCQIHAHEERGYVTMETHCSPSEHCLREEGHDPERCAQGLIETGPHGCVWCCSDNGCVDRYHYLLFPHMFTSPAVPITTTAPVTSGPILSTSAPVVKANCYLCEGATGVAACLGNPHNCDLTQEVCMLVYRSGKLTSQCAPDQYCRSLVNKDNHKECYSGRLNANETCAFCCEAPGCMERVVMPKLPSDMIDVELTTAAPPQEATTLQPLPVSTTKHPLGPNGEINCHVCEDAHHLDDCLRHPTYCHSDRNEICMVEYDPHGHVHSRCEHDRRVCLERELHNHMSCLLRPEVVVDHHGPPGPPGPDDHCVFCCDTTECFHASVGHVIIGR